MITWDVVVKKERNNFMKRLLVLLEELIFELLYGYDAYCDYYHLKYELGCGGLYNKEYDKWYSEQIGV